MLKTDNTGDIIIGKVELGKELECNESKKASHAGASI